MEFQPVSSLFSSGWNKPEEATPKYKKCIENLTQILTRIERDGKISSYSKGALTRCRKLAENEGFQELAEKIDLLKDRYSKISKQALKNQAHKDVEQLAKKDGPPKKRAREENEEDITAWRHEQSARFHSPGALLSRTVTKTASFATDWIAKTWHTVAPSKKSLLMAAPLALTAHAATLMTTAATDAWQTPGVIIRIAQDTIIYGTAIEGAKRLTEQQEALTKRHRTIITLQDV